MASIIIISKHWIKNACIPDMENDKINKNEIKIIQTLANINKGSIKFARKQYSIQT